MFLFCLIKGDTVKKDPSLGDVNSPFGSCELVASVNPSRHQQQTKTRFYPHPSHVSKEESLN